jgi:MFS family permease
VGRFFRVIHALVRDPAMARLMTAFVAFVVAEYAVWIGMLVYAYGHGGATAAGLVAFAQLAPGIVLAPVLSAVADRRSPTQLLAGGYLVQALSLAGVALSLWTGAPPLLAYGLAVLASTAMTTTRPALFAVLPALARDAQQLTAATVVAGWAENLGVVLSALIASLFLGLGQIGALFAVCAALVAGGAALGAPVRVTGMALADEGRPPSRFSTLIAGAREVTGQPRPRLLVSLLTAQYVVVGSLDVLFVVVAIEVLGRGQVWVGYLNTAYGAGAVAAGLLTAHLLGRRLGQALVTSLLALSVGLILTAFTNALGLVVTLIAVAGGGRAVLAVSANTLLQRVVPAQLVGRVFGIVEGLSMAGLAAGSLLTPLLVGLGGARLALITVGALLPVTAACGLRTLRQVDQGRAVPVTEVALLRSLPHFADLPGPALETLAGALERIDAVPGQVLIQQGTAGDRFYAIADGEVTVSVDGRPRGVRGRGTGLGEIALLRQVPRTATVTAVGPATLFALDAGTFLAAVSGHAPTRRHADQVATHWVTADTGSRPRERGRSGLEEGQHG